MFQRGQKTKNRQKPKITLRKISKKTRTEKLWFPTLCLLILKRLYLIPNFRVKILIANNHINIPKAAGATRRNNWQTATFNKTLENALGSPAWWQFFAYQIRIFPKLQLTNRSTN